ncbi:unnamed protein product [Caenorhabditis bovis]|uniref:ZP domain-containing protein n=1 Tax=Caenorhabditis bovis TaxID=2654633 RepID=A0A8S1EJ37_9PELO|nr:unnamed protein product [Caenorhabditis bovis]
MSLLDFSKILFILTCVYCKNSREGFVKEVACSAESLTVVIDENDPEVARWISNPKSQPVVYVYGHKTRHPCGTSMKNDKGSTNFNLTVPYGKECDVMLVDLQPNHRTAETTIVLEDNADLTYAKTMRINHVFCLYARNVQTIRFNDVTNAHEIIASTGGKPKPKIEMFFRSVDGKPLHAAKIGDVLEFFVALSPDSAYHGATPKECVFSDREDVDSPDARKITFVQSGCPVEEISEIIEPLANVNDQVYFSKFKTFRFGNQSTVFAHCQVNVCLKREECSTPCFKKMTNSTLTADRLRFRHRRSASLIKESKDVSEVSLMNTLTILSDSESRQIAKSSSFSSPIADKCSVTSEFSRTALCVMAALLSLVVISTTAAIYLACRIRKKSKESFDMLSAFTSSTMAVSGPYGIPSPYGMYHMEQQTR